MASVQEKPALKVGPFSFISSKSIKAGVSSAKKQQCVPWHASSLKCKSACQNLCLRRNGWLSIWQYPTSRCLSRSRIFSTSPDVHWKDMDCCKVNPGTCPGLQILAQMFYHCVLLLRESSGYPSTAAAKELGILLPYTSASLGSSDLGDIPHSQGVPPVTTVPEMWGFFFWFCDISSLSSFQAGSRQTVNILFVCFEQCDVVRQIPQ